MIDETQSDPMTTVDSYYRPQRSWAKVISLQASVCPRGGGGYLAWSRGGYLVPGGCLKFGGGLKFFRGGGVV